MAKTYSFVLTTLLFCFSAFLVLADSIETVELNNRLASEVAPMIRPLLKPGDGLSVAGNLLIIQTDPDRMRQIRKILGKIDKPLANLMITVRFDQQGSRRGTSSSLDANVPIGNDGRVIVGKPGNEGVALRHSSRSTRKGNTGSYQVRVIEGNEAFIYTGADRPVREHTVTVSPHGSTRQRGYVNQRARSGFYVVPQLQGDTVRLDIYPQNESFSSTHARRINRQSAQTTVSVKLGEWVAIGGIGESRQGQGSGTVYQTSRNFNRQSVIEIMVQKL